MGQRQMERGAAPHGVAHPSGLAGDGLRQQVGRSPEVSLNGRRASVAGGVGEGDGEASLESVHDGAPGCPGLGEAVQEDQRLRPGGDGLGYGAH